MAQPEHRPTFGSRLRVLRDPIRNKHECAAGCGTWPCRADAKGDRPWQAGDGPIPDSADEQPPPADFILNGKNLFPLHHRRGEPS